MRQPAKRSASTEGAADPVYFLSESWLVLLERHTSSSLRGGIRKYIRHVRAAMAASHAAMVVAPGSQTPMATVVLWDMTSPRGKEDHGPLEVLV